MSPSCVGLFEARSAGIEAESGGETEKLESDVRSLIAAAGTSGTQRQIWGLRARQERGMGGCSWRGMRLTSGRIVGLDGTVVRVNLAQNTFLMASRRLSIRWREMEGDLGWLREEILIQCCDGGFMSNWAGRNPMAGAAFLAELWMQECRIRMFSGKLREKFHVRRSPVALPDGQALIFEVQSRVQMGSGQQNAKSNWLFSAIYRCKGTK
ncbi:hypothetical protein B0H19DRAFT_1084991 [Mycena capillaripes]|nr:hypothetical protein B0H19DRAFT_1084991 [Mycena capillaripes]